jgi:hypothetical protein
MQRKNNRRHIVPAQLADSLGAVGRRLSGDEAAVLDELSSGEKATA